MRRGLASLAIVLIAAAAVGLLILHTGPVQSRILEWSVGELERRFDLDLTADALDYNLVTRRVVLSNVRLAARGHRDNPFFIAQAVTVHLPWAAYRGQLRFDNIIVDEGRVTITRDAGGLSNLPPGRGARDPNLPPRRVDTRGLVVHNLDFSYIDARRDLEIRAPGFRAALATTLGGAVEGPIAITGETLVRIGDRRVVIKPAGGEMAFDGSDVTLSGVTLDTTEGRFTVAGDIRRSLDLPTLDLTFKGTADIARASAWMAPPIHVAGPANLEATMTGAPSAFEMQVRLVSESADLGSERGVRVTAHARLTPNGIAVSRSTVTPRTGGEIHATLEVPFAADSAWWVNADWRGLDAASAFRLAEVRVLPFGAALSGTARIDRAAGQPYRLEVHNTAAPRAASGTAPLLGEVEFFVEGDRWRANQRHQLGATAIGGRIGGVWNRAAVARSTFNGELSADSSDIGQALRYAQLFGLASPALVAEAKGPLQATVGLDGVFAEPRFIGTAKSGRLEAPSGVSAEIAAEFDASARAVTVTNLNAVVGPTTAMGRAAVHLHGEVMADLSSRALSGALDLRVGLQEGPVEGAARLGGTIDDPDIVVDLSGTGLIVEGQRVDAVSLKARVIDEGITIDTLTARQGDGALRLTGRYEWNTRAYQVDMTGQGLSWRGPIGRLGDVEARAGLTFAGTGTLDRPAGEGVVEFTVAGGVAGELIDRGVANVRLNGETATVTGRIPSLGAFVTANVRPVRPFDYDAVVVMNRIDLAPLVTLSGLEPGSVTGTASLSATGKGTLSAIGESTVFINLQDLGADVSGVPVRLASPSRLSWDGSGLTIDVLDVALGQGRLLARGRLGERGIQTARWESTLKGDLGDVLAIARPFGAPAALRGIGPLTAEWQSTGGLDRSTATLHLGGGTLTWDTLPEVRDLTVDATFNGTTIEVKRLTGLWQDGGIEGAASVPRAIFDKGAAATADSAGFVKLRATGLTESAFAPWLSAERLAGIDGRLSATVDARITRPSLEGVTGTVTFDDAAFSIAGVDVFQARPSVLDIGDGQLFARDVVFNAGGTPLTLTGSARLAPADRRSLNLDLRGTADLRVVSAFAPTLATGGVAKINVGIGGPLNAPVFNGRIDVADAELALREPRVLIGDVSGTIALDGQRVLFDGLTGSVNGGALTLDGGFLLKGVTPESGGLTAQVQRAALEYPEGLQSEADAIVTLRPAPTGWTLTGEVRVERSVYNEPISLPALIAARRSRVASAVTEGGFTERLRLNLNVFTQQDLRLDNNYGRLEAGAAVRVLGMAANPVLAGRVTLREGGEVYLGGNTFRVSRGSISFTNPNRIVPEFDIELRTLVSGSDIILTLDGPLDRLQSEIRSTDPNVDSREAMSMLFGDLASEDAVALLSAELLGATGRAIGLDTLRVERGFTTDELRADPGLIATETDPSTRLTLSKRLRPDVELILSQSLRESGGLSAIVSYRPRRQIEIRAVSRDNVDRSIGLRHEITFGGGGDRSDVAAAAQPTVSAVTVSGEPGRPTEELVARLTLDPGDVFNFYQWQGDLDRIRAEFHERNYYEVRVRGTRAVSDDGRTVALDYRIEPGPVAELVVEGHPLEPELEKDIRAAWMRTIFDRFLLEDIQTRIRRHLLAENLIGSTVEVVVASATSAHKQIRITVAAGTPVDRRRIRFSGNAAFDADRLNTVVDAAGLGINGWLNPDRLAETIVTFYRSEGYLAATAKAAMPTVQGTQGVLPVSVEEGTRFVIRHVTFPGVSPNRLADVASAARLDTGMPYVLAEVDAARARVEDLYALEGFNTLQIEVDPEPDPGSTTVDLTFAILEGVQQVLREATTAGASRTREGVILRALRLRVGAPVNLADWSQARKRMYDTNVFRQVDIEPVPLTPTTEESAAGIQPVRAVVRVLEYPVWRFRYGTQFNDEQTEIPDLQGETRLQSIGVLADLQNQNLFGRALTAGIAGRYDRNRQAASLFTSNSSFFGLPIRSSGFIFGSRQRFIVDTETTTIDERIGVSAEQRWRPSRLSEVIWSYRFERDRAFDPDAPPDEVAFDPIRVARVNVGMLLDRRDDPSNPSRGWFAAANLDQAVEMLGSDYGNAKLLLQQSLYRRLGRVVVAGRAQLGSGFGDEALIRSQRFLLGGATTVRGYGENTLGPRDVLGLPAGGDALLALNAELRFPVRGWVLGVAFVDAGNVFETRGDLSFRNLAVGYGLGLRLASPFAMLRIDFGVPGTTLPTGRIANTIKSGRWYFGIGHIF